MICLFGRTDASRLIDTFKEVGNAKHTLVLLDYALPLAERRILARKTKTDLSGKIFAVRRQGGTGVSGKTLYGNGNEQNADGRDHAICIVSAIYR